MCAGSALGWPGLELASSGKVCHRWRGRDRTETQENCSVIDLERQWAVWVICSFKLSKRFA